MKKTFDCVRMKYRGAEQVREQLKDMTLDQELAFWQQRSQELRKRQRVIQHQKETIMSDQ